MNFFKVVFGTQMIEQEFCTISEHDNWPVRIKLKVFYNNRLQF